jgi:hypothetical protein
MRPYNEIFTMPPDQPTNPQRPTAKQQKARKQWADLPLPQKFVGVTTLIALALIGIWIAWAIANAIAHNLTSQLTTTSRTQNQAQPAQPTPAAPPAPPTKAQLIATWCSNNCTTLKSLGSDLTQFGTDAGNGDFTAANTDCKQIQSDDSTAQNMPAIPDPQSASDLSSALTYLSSMAQDCINGTANYDTSLILKANNELTEANAKLNATTADINALTNQ